MKTLGMLRNEEGSVLITALLLLVFLTLIGISATTTTTTDMQVARNEKCFKLAFYAAEAASNYVAAETTLYGALNITQGGKRYFPNNADQDEKQSLGSAQSFNGEVEYEGWTNPPPGSGFQAGKYRAHRYQMTITGYGPSDAESKTESGFYRIGF
jgi:Tfp pilus assembly protein PilX